MPKTTPPKSPVKEQNHSSLTFKIFLVLAIGFTLGSIIFLSQYEPAPFTPPPEITLEQKIAHFETGAPLPGQEARPEVPRWMFAIILGFIIIQIIPLTMAAYQAKSPKLKVQQIRQIKFLTETPLHLGLLGSLMGVAMTHFVSGTLSAPLAYLTTISGILLFLFGRFAILVSLPTTGRQI